MFQNWNLQHIADIGRYCRNRRWYTFFKLMYFLAKKKRKFWPALANLGCFVANICTCLHTFYKRWCTTIDIYQVWFSNLLKNIVVQSFIHACVLGISKASIGCWQLTFMYRLLTWLIRKAWFLWKGAMSSSKHHKNCECCPGHYLIVNRFSSIISWFKFRNLSVMVNCVTKSLIH